MTGDSSIHHGYIWEGALAVGYVGALQSGVRCALSCRMWNFLSWCGFMHSNPLWIGCKQVLNVLFSVDSFFFFLVSLWSLWSCGKYRMEKYFLIIAFNLIWFWTNPAGTINSACVCVCGNFFTTNLIKGSLLTDATELALRSRTAGNKSIVSHANGGRIYLAPRRNQSSCISGCILYTWATVSPEPTFNPPLTVYFRLSMLLRRANR